MSDFAKKLGRAMKEAARASVAGGAQYTPGENIITDPDAAWNSVAQHLIEYIDRKLEGKVQTVDETVA